MTKESQQKKIDFFQFIKMSASAVSAKWKIFSLLVCLTVAPVSVYLFVKPTEYKSEISFIIEEGKGALGGLAGLAGQFGFDIGSLSGATGVLSEDNISTFLTSKLLIRETLLETYQLNISIADKYAEVYGLKKKWKKSARVGKDILFYELNANSYERLKDSLLISIIEKIIKTDQLLVEKPEKKSSFLSLKVQMRDEKLSKLFAEKLVKNATERYIETKIKRQSTNVQKLQKISDSILNELNSITSVAASNQEQIIDLNPGMRKKTVNYEISARNKSVLLAVHGEVIKNLEIAKMSLTQETPTIQIVDSPIYPLETDKKNKIFLLIKFFVFALVFFSALIIALRRDLIRLVLK